MLSYVLKIALSAMILVAVSEIIKRNSGAAALLASLPLTSLRAFVWPHVDGAPDRRAVVIRHAGKDGSNG